MAATVASQVNITEVRSAGHSLVYRCVLHIALQKDEDMIGDAVANVGPVSICYDVAMDFRFYKKGVYKRHVITMTIPVQSLSGSSHSNVCKNGNENVNHAGRDKEWQL